MMIKYLKFNFNFNFNFNCSIHSSILIIKKKRDFIQFIVKFLIQLQFMNQSIEKLKILKILQPLEMLIVIMKQSKNFIHFGEIFHLK